MFLATSKRNSTCCSIKSVLSGQNLIHGLLCDIENFSLGEEMNFIVIGAWNFMSFHSPKSSSNYVLL